MECGFRPHDRDRMTQSMEVSLLGFGLFEGGFFLQHTNGHCGYPVNRWSTKRPPNGTKLDRWSPGGILGPLDRPRSIPRMSNTRSRKKNKRGAPEEVGVPDCKMKDKTRPRRKCHNTQRKMARVGVTNMERYIRGVTLKIKESCNTRCSKQNTYHVVNKNIASSKVTDERRRKRGCHPGHPQAQALGCP